MIERLVDIAADELGVTPGAVSQRPAAVAFTPDGKQGAVDLKALTLPVVTCQFKETRPGEEPRILSFYAKKARGLMARYAIDKRIERAEELKAFDVAGYAFKPRLSSEAEWVFTRPHPLG